MTQTVGESHGSLVRLDLISQYSTLKIQYPLSGPTVLFLLVANAINCVPTGVINVFWTDYLALRFFADRAHNDNWMDKKVSIATRMATHCYIAIQVQRYT